MGCSKMLSQIALGHSQSFILNSAYFENKVLNLSEIMIPPLMSSTMGSEDILALKDSSS
nr:MAG TPA: portal protein [Caudoviricetes sp.]